MTELDETFPRYRMLLYLANPLADLRVPLAAVVRLNAGDIHVVPRAQLSATCCLGSARAAAHVQALAPYLARIDSIDRLPEFLGPHFVLGDLHGIPTIDGWREWLEGAIA